MKRQLMNALAAAALLLSPKSWGNDECSNVESDAVIAGKLDNAKVLRYSKDINGAAEIMESVLQSAPSNVRALYNKALLLDDRGQHQMAVDTLSAATKIQERCAASMKDPDFGIYNTLGVMQLETGDFSSAEASFEAAVAHRSDLKSTTLNRALSNLGYMYYSDGRFEESRVLLEEAVQLGNDNAKQRLNKLDRAERIYEAKKQGLASHD